MKKLILLLVTVLLSSSQLQAQNSDDSKIIHFQRKNNFKNIPFPGELYLSKTYDIIYPDSLYNDGKIRIKKAIFQDLKFEFNSEFKNHIYTFTSFKSNKKNQKKLLQIIKKHFDIDELSKNQIAIVKKDNYEFKIMTIKKHIYITLKE